MSLDRRTPLKRGGPLPRSSTLKPRSAARERAYSGPDGRRALVARTLAEWPRCQAQVVCSGARTVDVHERLSRARGGSILDPVQGHHLAVCRGCHDWIGQHPAEAERRRLALPSHHRCPPCGPC